ncbi:hypothetical protein [Micromonospora humida]|uniref:hypothetical protein n=1 Tax=Micromonospora humida TaxID=2809018 RepID=UPI003435A329
MTSAAAAMRPRRIGHQGTSESGALGAPVGAEAGKDHHGLVVAASALPQAREGASRGDAAGSQGAMADHPAIRVIGVSDDVHPGQPGLVRLQGVLGQPDRLGKRAVVEAGHHMYGQQRLDRR